MLDCSSLASRPFRWVPLYLTLPYQSNDILFSYLSRPPRFELSFPHPGPATHCLSMESHFLSWSCDRLFFSAYFVLFQLLLEMPVAPLSPHPPLSHAFWLICLPSYYLFPEDSFKRLHLAFFSLCFTFFFLFFCISHFLFQFLACYPVPSENLFYSIWKLYSPIRLYF